MSKGIQHLMISIGCVAEIALYGKSMAHGVWSGMSVILVVSLRREGLIAFAF